jgi:glycosyltransferase involved in cell wall biosynthesis
VLVFTSGDRPDVWAPLAEAEAVGMPCVAWCHNGPGREAAAQYARNKAVRRIVCVSHPQADVYRDKRGFEKMAVVHNAVDTAAFAPPDEAVREPHTVCYVGALTPSKGFHHVARAWPQVRAAVPKARLLVVGSARLYDADAQLGPLQVAQAAYEREHLIPHLGATQEEAKARWGVTFHGLLAPQSLRTVLHRATVGVVNPNTRHALETFCIAAVEMQAAGVPVVGARRMGLRETVRHHETGWLVDAPSELASALVRLLREPDATHRMRRAAKRCATRFNIGHVVARWADVLRDVHAGRPPTPPPLKPALATPRTYLREALRRLHRMLGPGERFPPLDALLNRLRR